MKCLVGGFSSANDTLHVLPPSNAWARPAVGPAWLNLSFSSLRLKINCLTLVHHTSVDFPLCIGPGLTKPFSIGFFSSQTCCFHLIYSCFGSHLGKTVHSHSLDFDCAWVLLTAPFLWVQVFVISWKRCTACLVIPGGGVLFKVVELGSAAGIMVDLRRNLSLSVPLFICRLKMILSSQGCQSLAIINVCRML